MRLDAHHSFSERYPLATLASILKRNRFEGSILVASPGLPPQDVALLPEFVRALVISMDGAESVDPWRLDEYQRSSLFRGVLCRPASGLPEGLEELERRRLTLDLQGGLGWIPQIAERFPGLPIAIVHLGGPPMDGAAGEWERWAAALEAAARAPRVCCKLSGLAGLAHSQASAGTMGQPLRPYVQHALTVFGPERLMFGSGWPEALPEHTWKESLAAFTQAIGARSMEVREQLLGATAGRFYGISQ